MYTKTNDNITDYPRFPYGRPINSVLQFNMFLLTADPPTGQFESPRSREVQSDIVNSLMVPQRDADRDTVQIQSIRICSKPSGTFEYIPDLGQLMLVMAACQSFGKWQQMYFTSERTWCTCGTHGAAVVASAARVCESSSLHACQSLNGVDLQLQVI